MAVDTEAKRWSMLAFASGVARTHVFNPDTSGLVSIEKITVLQHYGGIVWASPGGGRIMSSLVASGGLASHGGIAGKAGGLAG